MDREKCIELTNKLLTHYTITELAYFMERSVGTINNWKTGKRVAGKGDFLLLSKLLKEKEKKQSEVEK